ncbi:MAG: YceI family protein, partial [Jannaschia sp.]
SASVGGAANWIVEEGTLSITVTQLGADVTGSFADWQAAIDFDETPREDGTLGTVEVGIATGSLTLGSVTAQATDGDFLDVATHPQAMFRAIISAEQDAYIARGTLDLRGAEVPVALPFTLSIDGDNATMIGTAELDRRDFAMGSSYPDETNVGFGVLVHVALTATRAP